MVAVVGPYVIAFSESEKTTQNSCQTLLNNERSGSVVNNRLTDVQKTLVGDFHER